MKRTALTGILLALVAIGICACPSRNSEQFDPDKDVTPGGDIPGEDSPNLPPADDAGAWDDYVPASGTAQLSLTLIAPGTCGCSAPAPEEPLLCGWTAGAKASLKAKATVAVDGQPVPGTQVESLELFFVDPATGEETLLDRVEGVGTAELLFDVEKVPGGAEAFGGDEPEAKVRVRATAFALDAQGEKLQKTTDRTLAIDLVPPDVKVLVPESGAVIQPYIEKIPYTVEVTDSGSGFGQVAFLVNDYELAVLLHGELTEGELTTLTGVLDAQPLGVYHGSLTVAVEDCVGNQASSVVPFAVVSTPKFLQPPTVSCADVKDEIVTGQMKRLRSGKGDPDDAAVDLLIAAGQGIYVAWAEGSGDFLPLQLLVPLKYARDARFADITGDGLPDLVAVHRHETENRYVVSLYKQLPALGEGGSRAFAFVESRDVGENPFALETADINGDGFVDLLVAHEAESDSVALVRHTGKAGNGDGQPDTYFEMTAFLTGVGSISDVKFGDVNGDGAVDIVTTRGEEGILSTYLNTGKGTYMMAHDTLLTGQEVPLLGLGDFNSDSLPDALVFVKDFGAAYELNGKGNGYFAQADNSGLGWSTNYQEAVASILSWEATEHFVPKAGKAVIVGENSNSLVVADFNVDGIPDAAISESKQGLIQLFWGLGDGTLAESYFLNAWPQPYSLIADDLNQDPIPDMACLRKDTCEIVLFLSRDDGGCGHPGNGIELPCPLQVGNPERAGVPLWSATAEIPAPVHALWEEFGRLNPTHVLASDFDNNGRTDAVMITAPPLDQTLSCIDDDDPENPVENWVDPHGVISFTGVGDPDMAIDMFKSMMGFDFYFGIADVAVGNFNDDPYPDIAVASLRKNPCTGCTGSWMRNVDVLVGGYAISPITLDNGKTMVCGAAPGDEVVPGGFLATGGRAYDSSPSAIAAARLDGDEIDDIIVAIRGNGVSGNNCSVPDELLVLPTRHEPQAGPCEAPPPPFNVCEAWTYSDCSAEYTVCESQTSVKYPATGEFPVAIATGDVNNDGIVDILAANQKTHDVTLLTGTIDPWGEYVVDTLEHPAKLISLGEEPRDIALGDVDGDGFLDLVGAFEKKVSISWGVDGTNFETPFYIEALPCGAGIFPSKAIAADFSGDGFDDVLVLSKKTSRIYLYVSLGQRSFAGPYQFTAASKPTDIQMCDINQDGCTDLMVANEDSHTVSLLVNEFCP